MKIWNCVLLAAVAAAAWGCAKPQVWGHSSKTSQDFYRESAQCQAMAGRGHAPQVASNRDPVLQGYNQGAAMASAQNQKTIYSHCMMGNGWFLTD